ncbi:MAG: hypothetical protein DLM70_09035 [Chloroflexi bacterium]|nr:MAG: hypothetical protein DLM70_09035 [Chloroflexota bacterium]
MRLPLWANAGVGLVMLTVGLYFFMQPQRGMSSTLRLIILAGYIAVSLVYLVTALRQYRNRRRDP